MKRLLLKLSGEALSVEGKRYDDQIISGIATQVKQLLTDGYQIGIVIGGGNYWRGRTSENIDRTKADQIGMLATVMNAVALQCALRKLNVSCRVQSAIDINKIAEPYVRFKAVRHLEKGRVVIFAAGTGNPFFTTDTAAALRASEIDADVMLMAKNGVDGVYTADPKLNPDAKKYDRIAYDDIIIRGLKVMDTASCSLCKENNIPIIVFDFVAKGAVMKILNDEKIGTYVGGTNVG